MKKSTKSGVWDYDTGVPGMVRHAKYGHYYSRYQVNGKRTMKALETDVHSVAKLRHLDLMAKNERTRQSGASVEAGKGTMGGILDKALAAHGENTALTGKAKQSFALSIKRLTEHWPKCFDTDLRTAKPTKIGVEQVETFANYLHSRAQWRKHNSKRERRGYGPVTVNVTLEALHRVLRFAKNRGYITEVPFDLKSELGKGSMRKPEPQKVIRFPSQEKIRSVFMQMRTISDTLPENQLELRAYLVARAQESGDLAEFMAFSGARIQEAAVWTWEDELPDAIMIRGTKTKDSRNREVPKIAAMRDLLARMKARRKAEGRTLKGRAFTISQCREALESACKRAGVDRWTHHSLRHLFATTCIESGIDLPTVSRWLGHADGGALAMKTYGHLRQEHSQAQAAKVSFGGGM